MRKALKTNKLQCKVFPQMKSLLILLKKVIIKAKNQEKMMKKLLKNQI